MITKIESKQLQITPRITFIETTEDVKLFFNKNENIETMIEKFPDKIISTKLTQIEKESMINNCSLNEQITNYNQIAKKYQKEINVYVNADDYGMIKDIFTTYRK